MFDLKVLNCWENFQIELVPDKHIRYNFMEIFSFSDFKYNLCKQKLMFANFILSKLSRYRL